MTVPASKWVIRPKPAPDARRRLFCFPFAGGGAMTYRTWPAHLPADSEVCAVQLPGREGRLREPLFRSLTDLIPPLADALEPFLDRPCAFFGHSMGAIIAFELARELRRRRVSALTALLVSARIAPQTPDPDRPVYQLPEPEFIDRLRTFNGTPDAVLQNPELLAMLVPILRADFAINEGYVYAEEPPLDVPIAAFGGDRDPVVPSGKLGEWASQTSAGFSQRIFAGDHFFLNSAQAELIRAIVPLLSGPT